MKRVISILPMLMVIVFFSTVDTSYSQVTVTERNTVIPTYEVKDADPNPIFYNGRRYQGAQGRVYPYPLIHNLTNNLIDKTYREVIIENDYVEVSILPDLGGRVYYARDKTNDYKYLYHNEVIKPALIGMTGAWISGGVEWNIPHHHRATSFTPVDYTITEHADGSQTVWVGETEWRHRSRWIVGITLHPGSTLFETTIRIFNTTPFQNSTLLFANAAVHTNENYQVIFPPQTQYATFHRKNQFTEWPVSHQFYNGANFTDGVDVSRWINHSNPSSFFEWGNKGNFIAGIDHGTGAGTVIFGNKYENPGKKLWSWGNNEQGAMWDRILTDENGPYIELMFGSYSDNQPDYSWMQPREVKEANYWFAPLRGLDDVKMVNEHAILTFDGDETSIHLGIKSNRVLENVRVQVGTGDRFLFNEEMNIYPDQPYVADIENTPGIELYDMTLTVLDAAGETLISYSPEEIVEEPMPEPVSPLQEVSSIRDADSLYYQGLYYEQFHDAFYEPRDFYKRAVELNPQHVSALLRTGILDLKDGDYESAVNNLEQAAERVTWDYVTPERADPLYYLALAYIELERHEEAYELLYKSSWNYKFHSAAHYQMALMKSIEGDYVRALDHVSDAYTTNTRSIDILSLKMSLLRVLDRSDEAEYYTEQALETDPLNFRGYYEKFMLTGDQQILDHLKDLMRDSPENYLELAIQYGNAGLYSDALNILRSGTESDNEELRSYPVIHYYLGYYNHLIGNRDAARDHYTDAAEMPHEYAFPFRFETVKALETAHEYNPGDGLAWYYMGNIFYDHQPEKAIEAWEQAVELNSGIPVAHRNLAFAYANVENDLESTMYNIRRAIELNPDDPRYYYEHDLYLETLGTEPAERLAPFSENHDVVISDLTTLFPYVELLTLNGQYGQAIDLMKSYYFRRWEGGGGVYTYWIYSHLNEAIAALDRESPDTAAELLNTSISYPENLQTRRNQFETIVYYYKGIVAGETGNTEQARLFYEQAASDNSRAPESRFYSAKAYERLDREDDAESIYRSLIQSGEQDLDEEASVDFFDPFSEVETGDERMAEGYFKMALGYLGLGDTEQAQEYFDRALDYDPAILSLAFN